MTGLALDGLPMHVSVQASAAPIVKPSSVFDRLETTKSQQTVTASFGNPVISFNATNNPKASLFGTALAAEDKANNNNNNKAGGRTVFVARNVTATTTNNNANRPRSNSSSNNKGGRNTNNNGNKGNARRGRNDSNTNVDLDDDLDNYMTGNN